MCAIVMPHFGVVRALGADLLLYISYRLSMFQGIGPYFKFIENMAVKDYYKKIYAEKHWK